MNVNTKASLAILSGLGVITLVKSARAAKREAKMKEKKERDFREILADISSLDQARDMLMEQIDRREITIKSIEDADAALKFNMILIREGLV